MAQDDGSDNLADALRIALDDSAENLLELNILVGGNSFILEEMLKAMADGRPLSKQEAAALAKRVEGMNERFRKFIQSGIGTDE